MLPRYRFIALHVFRPRSIALTLQKAVSLSNQSSASSMNELFCKKYSHKILCKSCVTVNLPQIVRSSANIKFEYLSALLLLSNSTMHWKWKINFAIIRSSRIYLQQPYLFAAAVSICSRNYLWQPYLFAAAVNILWW